MSNEAFKNHYNFRPRTLEETRYSVEEDTWLDVSQISFATLDDTLVGFVKAGLNTKRNISKGVKRGIIASIGVLPAYRRRCIGTALLLYSLQYLKTLDLDVAELYVDDLNPTHAIRLYEKTRFTTFETSATYSKTTR
jgi:ribosomal protein S18 acetylase RimI-like enzyme